MDVLLTNSSIFLDSSANSFTAWITDELTFWIWTAVSSVVVASLPISSATTAKPLPASPALAASILAFKASKLVWSVILIISSANVPICLTSCERLSFSVKDFDNLSASDWAISLFLPADILACSACSFIDIACETPSFICFPISVIESIILDEVELIDSLDAAISVIEL